ncbi:MAG: hypothetical protein D6E12_11045 [Desulfovibrio sp.]|nr:MAG: hypothetical protein D6E12_11045 [Desulfovibrio sp.]
MRQERLVLGRISYLNVLPVYLPLETGMVEHPFEIVSGPPAELNQRMERGELHISAVSSIEYARRSERYLLVPDLAIGSSGPVQSVILLSRAPVENLADRTVLVSAETHTSAALLKILFAQHFRIPVKYRTGDATQLLDAGEYPPAVLAIGDEALTLREHPAYPHRLDLGEAWRHWTGLPFIFGVWAVRRDVALARADQPWRILSRAKEWGLQHMDSVLDAAMGQGPLKRHQLQTYFDGLVYELGPREQEGLKRFFACLHSLDMIPKTPALEFADRSTIPA